MENNECIRILHVFGELNRGGAETMIMNLYRNIDRKNIQFDFIVHTENVCDYDEEIKKLGGKIYRIPRYRGKNHFEYKKAWEKFFSTHSEYKIIHGHVRSTASIYMKIAKKYNKITISHSHSISSGRGFSSLVKNILQYRIRYISDYLFACSKEAGIWLFGRKSINKDNFFIVKNSIQAEKFEYDLKTRDEIRKEFNIENRFVIGHIGRFHPSKNHEFLIDIFKEIYNINKKAILILVGEGDLKQLIIDKVKKLNLEENVLFLGGRSDINRILQGIDIFVFPSLYEGLGIVAIEAQASGLKTIVSNKIPKEAYITDLVEVVDLDEPTYEWARKINKYAHVHNRRSTFKDICNKGYNINETVRWIEKFYIGKVKEYD